jgi:hypothetical protein
MNMCPAWAYWFDRSASWERWASPKPPSTIAAPSIVLERRNLMLWTIIVILVVLWLLGFLGPTYVPSIPRTGNVIHILIVIAVILVVLNLLGRI